MSPKDCGNHRHRHRLYRRLFASAVALVVMVLFIILIVYLTLRPTKPKFYLQDATVLSFNLSAAPSLLSSVLQVTVSSRNPNSRVGVFYDHLSAFAVYKNQQITLASALPPIYQGNSDVDVWSPYLYGTSVPIAPYVAAALQQDEGAGFLVLYVRVAGRLKWKVGTWTSDHYRIDVSCPAFLSFEGGRGGGGGPSIRFQQLTTCSVDV